MIELTTAGWIVNGTTLVPYRIDIYNCPKHLKGQMKIGDFCG